MTKSLSPRPGAKTRRPVLTQPHLPRDIVDEINRSTKPTAIRDALSRLSRAIELLERGDAHAAAIEAQKAKALSPRSAAVREVLGLALYGDGDWQGAVTELKTYKRMTGRVDQNHLIADALRALGKPKEAVPLAEEELRDRAVPHEAKAEAVIVAACALADQGRYAEALAFMSRAKTAKDVAEDYTLRLWYARGDILAKAGRPAEAEEEFRKIIRHEPAAFDAAERLAELSSLR